MKNNWFTGKSTRTKIYTVISVALVILLIGATLLISIPGIYGNFYIDMTPEGLYTVRPLMMEVCEDILCKEDGSLREEEITVIFCDDRDHIIQNTYTRVLYYMAIEISRKFDNFKVDAINVRMNPTAVADYKTTSLSSITPNDVIVSYGVGDRVLRYKITSADSFWHVGNKKVYAFDGEHKLASILLSLTMIDRPVAYFVTGHGEDVYDFANPDNPENRKTGAFIDLLRERGFEIKTLDLQEIIDNATGEPRIYDDCALLIINNPKEDFKTDPGQYNNLSYVSETELVDRYLTENRGSVLVAKDYKIELPTLEDFCREWGIGFVNNLVKDPESYIENDSEAGTTIITEYNGKHDSYGYGIYSEYVDLGTSPRVVISDSGHIVSGFGEPIARYEQGSAQITRIFDSFLFSTAASNDYGKNELTGTYVDRAGDDGQRTLAAICGRESMDINTGERTHSYLFAAASADFFSTDLIGNASYANYDIVSAMIHNVARLETHADSALGGMSANNSNDAFLGKFLVDTAISEDDNVIREWSDEEGRHVAVKTVYGLTSAEKIAYTVIIALIPFAIAVTGVVVFIKRKYL